MVDNEITPGDSPLQDMSLHLTQTSQNPFSAKTLTTVFAAVQNASLPTAVSTAEPTTQQKTVLPRWVGPDVLLKPQPWTPIRSFVLERELSNHPDKAFVRQLTHDLQHGCAIGYNGPQFANSAKNLSSAYQQPEVIDATLQRECEAGRILGPFPTPPLSNFRTSGLGLVPKHDGGWRIIYHLSAPLGLSINDFIDPSMYSLSYCSVDDAYAFINQLGPGTLLSKIDLKDAFRLIPVCPNDWNLLGIHWRQQFFIDTCLPFGLRSAPFLFNRLADAIHWTLQNNYNLTHLLHYLDDFLTAGPPHSDVCANNLRTMLAFCDKINAPIKPSKVEGPTTSLTFLGIHINTVSMEASITSDRKQSLLQELQNLHCRHKCTKRELLSLIGKLSFSCKVLPAGRIFLRRLIDLSTKAKMMHHHIRLNSDARLDLQWWLDFLPQWSGKSLILNSH